MKSRIALLAACFLLLVAVATTAIAQIEPPKLTDCNVMCSSTSNCNADCEYGGGWITCGDYGTCDYDPDFDGIRWPNDNCPYTANANQADCDGDGRGDVCDSTDNSFVAVEGPNKCWIRNRLHLWGTDTTMYWETRYGNSTCGSPDYWQKSYEYKNSCIGVYDEYSCCTSTFGSSDCNTYWFNYCHY